MRSFLANIEEALLHFFIQRGQAFHRDTDLENVTNQFAHRAIHSNFVQLQQFKRKLLDHRR